MSTVPLPHDPQLPDFLQSQEPPTLESILKLRATTRRGPANSYIQGLSVPEQLEHCLNTAVYDISLWMSAVERHIKEVAVSELPSQEITDHLEAINRELKLCQDIGNFAIGQLVAKN